MDIDNEPVSQTADLKQLIFSRFLYNRLHIWKCNWIDLIDDEFSCATLDNTTVFLFEKFFICTLISSLYWPQRE